MSKRASATKISTAQRTPRIPKLRGAKAVLDTVGPPPEPTTAREQSAERAALVRTMLALLVALEDGDRARREAKSAHRKKMHTDQNFRVGYGGAGAPWSDIDRVVEQASDGTGITLAERDAELSRAMFDSLAYAWRDGGWCPGRYVLSERGLQQLVIALFVANLQRAAARVGLGVVPAGSVNAACLAMTRAVLTDTEIGNVLAAARDLGPGPHSREQLDRELQRVRAPRADRSKCDEGADARFEHHSKKRWNDLLARGFCNSK